MRDREGLYRDRDRQLVAEQQPDGKGGEQWIVLKFHPNNFQSLMSRRRTLAAAQKDVERVH